MQNETAGVLGISLYLQPVQDLTLDSSVSATQYQFVLENPNLGALNEWVPKLAQRLRASPDLADVADDLSAQGLETDLVIDRAAAARFGVTPATIDNALYDMFGQRIISTIYTQSNQYRVIMEGSPAIQHSLAGLNAIYLPSAAVAGGQVPISAIVHVEQHAGPLEISHLGPVPGHHRSPSMCRPPPRSAPPSPRCVRRRRISGCRPASSPRSRAPPRRWKVPCPTSCCW